MNIISLGLGTQSTAVYYMSSLGLFDRADYAIFADTGNEEPETYKYLMHLRKWQQKNNGIPIITARSVKTIGKSILSGLNSKQRFVSIPLFTKSESGKIGMLRRQCTSEFKVKIVDKKIREIHGLPKYARNLKTSVWLGISKDEISRMKEPREKWKTFVYPLLNEKVFYNGAGIEYAQIHEYGKFTRTDCMDFIKSINQPIPSKSACTFCPYQDNARWLDKKNNAPKLWRWLVKFDKSIRNGSQKGFTQPLFLHRSGVPLDEIDFNVKNNSMFENECAGMCGI